MANKNAKNIMILKTFCPFYVRAGPLSDLNFYLCFSPKFWRRLKYLC